MKTILLPAPDAPRGTTPISLRLDNRVIAKLAETRKELSEIRNDGYHEATQGYVLNHLLLKSLNIK